MIVGEVVSVSGGVAQVRLPSDKTNLEIAEAGQSYRAAPGDTVLLARAVKSWVIMDKIGPVQEA